MRVLNHVVLASVSPRRYELLTALGLHVRIVPSFVEEGERPGFDPRELALAHAVAKADAVADREPDAVIVAADTVVDLDGVALGKPRDEAEAREMLRALQGRDHVVHSAYAIVDAGTRRTSAANSTRVRFFPLDDADIAAYVAGGEPMDKAGAYGIQGRGAALVERIDGDFYTVMGLPVGLVVRALRAFGYRLPDPLRPSLNGSAS